MRRLYPEQLAQQLSEGLRTLYLLIGNEPLLLQECLEQILNQAQQHEFAERLSYTIDNQFNWEELFYSLQEIGLFAAHKIFVLDLTESGINAAIAEKLSQLLTSTYVDNLLILQLPRLTKPQENSRWFKQCQEIGAILINCLMPDQNQLPRWVALRAKSRQLEIDPPAIQLLCYCYEGNLLALAQAIERLSLLYPGQRLTLPLVEKAVDDAAQFTPYQWVDALLAGKTKRAWHVLQQLKSAEFEPLILLRTLQKELLQLLNLQQQMQNIPLKQLFDQHKIWQTRRPLFTQALQRLTPVILQQAISLLTSIELTVKQSYHQSPWSQLESLSMLLCGKSLPGCMIND